jgi:alanine dehydrogenase
MHSYRGRCDRPGRMRRLARPRTATRALTSATLPYVLRLAAGVDDAVERDPGLAEGLNVRGGAVVNHAVSEAFSAATSRGRTPIYHATSRSPQ